MFLCTNNTFVLCHNQKLVHVFHSHKTNTIIPVNVSVGTQ